MSDCLFLKGGAVWLPISHHITAVLLCRRIAATPNCKHFF